MLQSAVRFLPSYRLESQKPFNKEKCEKLMKSQIDVALEEFIYSSSEAEALALSLSERILAKIKEFQFDRYLMWKY